MAFDRKAYMKEYRKKQKSNLKIKTNCLFCGKETTNPKFCSNSCSGKSAGRNKKKYLTEEERKAAINKQNKEYSLRNIEKITEYKKKWWKDNPDYAKEYYQNNKEKLAINSKNRYQKNREKILDNAKKYRNKNLDKLIAKDRAYKKKNKEILKEKDKIRNAKPENKAKARKRYIENKEEITKRNKLWVKNNRERKNFLVRRWRKNNSEKVNAQNAKRRAIKLNAIPKNQTKSEREAIKQFYLNCPKGYEVDHIVPLIPREGNPKGKHELKNLQYLTKSENVKKSNIFPYYPISFYKKRGLL